MKKLLFLAAAVLMFAACAQDEGLLVEESSGRQILISPVLTRVGDTAFDEGDQIGVSIVVGGETYADNSLLTYSGGVFSGSLSWYDGTSSSTIEAYFPYDADGVPTSFSVSTDQTDGTSSSEFVASVLTDVTPSTEAITMTFYHLFSKVVVNVTNESSYSVSSVKLTGSQVTADVSASELTATVSDNSETAEITLYEEEEGTTYRAIVVPQTVALGVTIVYSSNDEHSLSLATTELKSGYYYTVNVTMADDGISVTSSYPTPESGATYTLQGSVDIDGFTWPDDATLGLFSATDGVEVDNASCSITSGAGGATASFTTPGIDLVAGKNAFVAYYPYSSTVTYSDGVVSGLAIDSEQELSAPDVLPDVVSLGSFTGIPGVDEYFEFELAPAAALAEIKLSSSDYAGYYPVKLTVYDDYSTALAGSFDLAVDGLTCTASSDAVDTIEVTVTTPEALSASSTQSLYMSILPGDFSETGLWIVVELEDSDGNSVWIPTQPSGLVFTSGETTEIDLSNLSAADNAADWYMVGDTRLLTSAIGVAYGEANTYFIQCKTGSTYNGATYSANADIPDEVTIDYRARGNFFAAEEPEDVSFEWFVNSGSTAYTMRTSGYDASGVDPTAYSFEANTSAYTVTVTNTGAYAGAPILLMKKDGVVLWAWTFWNVAADGTSIEPVTVGSYELLPMDIGQATTQYSTWASNSDPVWRTINLYQWGRPMPVFWNSYWSLQIDISGITYSGNVPGLSGPMSFANSIANPVGVIVDVSSYPTATTMTDWCSESYGDLWGGNISSDPTDSGSKSIYDPCPKGYRVASPDVYAAIEEMSSSATYTSDNYYTGWSVGGLYFLNQGYLNGKTNGSDNRVASMGGSTTSSSYGIVWSNYVGAHSASQPRVLSQGTSSATVSYPSVHTYYRSISAAVRCMVDSDNR